MLFHSSLPKSKKRTKVDGSIFFQSTLDQYFISFALKIEQYNWGRPIRYHPILS
jgi:hypothetical protein